MLKKKIRAIALICASLPIMSFMVGINPAQAHHPLGGGTPSIFAETTPVVAYLLGFASIQMIISAIAFYLGKIAINQVTKPSNLYFVLQVSPLRELA